MIAQSQILLDCGKSGPFTSKHHDPPIKAVLATDIGAIPSRGLAVWQIGGPGSMDTALHTMAGRHDAGGQGLSGDFWNNSS